MDDYGSLDSLQSASIRFGNEGNRGLYRTDFRCKKETRYDPP